MHQSGNKGMPISQTDYIKIKTALVNMLELDAFRVNCTLPLFSPLHQKSCNTHDRCGIFKY